jgi:hypothetical protein
MRVVGGGGEDMSQIILDYGTLGSCFIGLEVSSGLVGSGSGDFSSCSHDKKWW